MKKLLLIILGIVFAALVFFVLKGSEFYKKIYTPNLFKKPAEKTSYNILLFGYGGGKHEGAFLTDTIMLFHIDLKSKRATLLSIPRDLWLKLPTKSGNPFHMKINALYQLELGEIGDVSQLYPDLDQSHFGAQNDAEFTKYILAQTLNIPVDNYIGVDFAGFKKAIDVLEGVDINVLKSFTDPQYPIDGKEDDLCDKDIETKFNLVKDYINNPSADQEKLKQLFKDHKSDDQNKDLEMFYKNITDTPEKAFPCRYETLHFDQGLQHMDGEIALKYVRSRHALQDGTDFGRSARQQQLMKAVKDKVLSIGFIPKILPLLDELGNHVKTDLSIDDIKKFIGFSPTINQYQLTTFVISDQNFLSDSWSNDGQFILIPKEGEDQWTGLRTSIQNIFEGILPTATPIATPSGTLK